MGPSTPLSLFALLITISSPSRPRALSLLGLKPLGHRQWTYTNICQMPSGGVFENPSSSSVVGDEQKGYGGNARSFEIDTLKVVPLPWPGITHTLPPCLSAISFTIASPRPVPWMDIELFLRIKTSKSFFVSDSFIPTPLSVTETT